MSRRVEEDRLSPSVTGSEDISVAAKGRRAGSVKPVRRARGRETETYEKPPHAATPLKPANDTRPSMMSDMCTSTALKPAAVKAHAIST